MSDLYLPISNERFTADTKDRKADRWSTIMNDDAKQMSNADLEAAIKKLGKKLAKFDAITDQAYAVLRDRGHDVAKLQKQFETKHRNDILAKANKVRPTDPTN